MESTITFRNTDGTSNVWRCRELPLKELLERETNTLLGEAYLFWSDFINPSTAFDFASESDDAAFTAGPSGLNPGLTSVFRVDCRSRNPFDFRIGLPGHPDRAVALRRVTPDHIRRILTQDMNYAKGCRKPLYQHIHQQFDGATQECYRLLLPVLGDARDITEIFGFCRPGGTERKENRVVSRSEKSTHER